MIIRVVLASFGLLILAATKSARPRRRPRRRPRNESREFIIVNEKSSVAFFSLFLSLSLSLRSHLIVVKRSKNVVFFSSPFFRLAWKKKERNFLGALCRQKKKSRRALVLSSTSIKSIMFVVATPSKTPASSSASPSRSSRRCAVASASTIPSSSSSSSSSWGRSSGLGARIHDKRYRNFTTSKDNVRNLNDNGSATRPSSSSSFVAKSTSDGGFDGFDTGTSITDEDQERLQLMSQEIKDWLKLLYVKREMSFNEVKLIIGIEDPRLADRRERYGIEDESGCSAEEKIQVLQDVDEGRVPTDIVACEFVLNELREWPGLDSDTEVPAKRETGPSRYEEIAMDAAGIKGRTRNPKRMLDNYLEEGEQPEEKNLFGFLPLYAVSSAPIFITIFALGIMFVNSLQ